MNEPLTPRTLSPRFALCVASVSATVLLAGCGFKGPLELPSKSGSVVIRTEGGQTTEQKAPTGTTSEDPNKLPPPDLPRRNRGSPRD
jgi:predicted small lipoprotein YifL